MESWYTLDRKQFFEYMSSENHAAPLKRYRFSQGRGRDTEAVEINTGTGLSFTVLADRCCDIAQFIYKGVPLAWISNAGIAAPSYYNGVGLHWRDTFTGGLITTCGLDTAGPPSCDEGVEYGLHGSVGHIPAEEVCAWGEWEENAYRMHVKGKIRHAFPLAESLLLERHIWTELGKSELHVEDKVTNLGAKPAALMLIYHMNFGYPLVSPETSFYADAMSVKGTSDFAQRILEEQSTKGAYRFSGPSADYQPHAYTHQMNSRDGWAWAMLCNKGLGLGVTLRFTADTLPRLSLWKHLCSGNYLAAMEPMNCLPTGRAANRAAGMLPMIEPGESRRFGLQVCVCEGEEELCSAAKYSGGRICNP